MDELKRFPYLVGRLLEAQTGKAINSFNGGRSGNTTFNSITVLLGKVIPMNPNAVVMMENVNDLTVLLFEKTYWNRNPSRGQLVTISPEVDHDWPYYLLKGFKNLFIKNFYNAGWDIVQSRQKQKTDEFEGVRRSIKIDEQTTSEIVSAFRKNLELFIYICKLEGIEPVLMTQQNRLTELPDPAIQGSNSYEVQFGITYQQYKGLYEAMNATVRAVGKEKGVLVIDLASRIPHDREYLYDMVHFTEKGSIEAASIIATELRASVLGRPQGLISSR